MPPGRDRRSFLRHAVTDAVRDVARGRRALAGELQPSVPEAPPGRPWAEPAGSTCDRAGLERLAYAHGIGHRMADVHALSMVSFRLLPERREVRSTPAPESTGVRVVLDLVELTGCSPLLRLLPRSVALRADWKEAQPAAFVTLAAARQKVSESRIDGQAVSGSAELVLPRPWAAPVEALELDDTERGAWGEVRAALASSQGIRPLDATEQTHRLHRLLGHPDERSGTLPLSCEMFVRGISEGADLSAVDPQALERAAQDWRLFLQVAHVASTREETVTFWCRRADFDRGVLERMVAIRRPV